MTRCLIDIEVFDNWLVDHLLPVTEEACWGFTLWLVWNYYLLSSTLIMEVREVTVNDTERFKFDRVVCGSFAAMLEVVKLGIYLHTLFCHRVNFFKGFLPATFL